MEYLQNLHTHTFFCDGHDSPEDMVKSAVEKEKAWEEAQVPAIENSIKPQDPELKNTVNAQLEVLETFKKKLIEK